MLDTMTCPFDGDNFMNLKCLECGYKPSDLNYIADGITCPRCILIIDKKIVIDEHYVHLNDRPENIIAYTEEIEKYLKD